ncbi:hypothetical protein ACQE2J_16270 [Brevibacterium sp. LE-L]|uniref:hypothetical protein n=1 Tax=unclassified Brevibacterium TaxID=2614124 RepID=UPI003CE98149
MSTTRVPDYPKSLPVRLGKRAAFFLFIAILGFLFVKVVGPLLQTGPELVVESIVSGVPLLIAAGCAIAAVTAKLLRSIRRSAT